MAEYKDITKLKTEISDVKQELWESSCQNRSYITGYASSLSYVEGMIASLPAADVETVKHGHWKHVAGMNSQCSECDRYFPVSEFDKRPFDINYCPNCGAKMDGKEVQE